MKPAFPWNLFAVLLDAGTETTAMVRPFLVGATDNPQRDFRFIARQRGMFSFFGIDTAQVHALRERHHVYMTDASRMNIAGLRRENLEYFARAVAQVLAG